MKKTIAFSISLLVILLDQLTKYWAMMSLMPFESTPVFPMLNWTLAFNTGSAFSFLATSGAWHLWFFAGFSALISLGIIIWIIRLQESAYQFFQQVLALALILSGAIGNLIDRIRIGYVIDFIDFHYKAYHWPIFNLADTAICLGGIWLAIIWLKEKP